MRSNSLSEMLKKKLLWYIGLTMAIFVTFLTMLQVVQLNSSIMHVSDSMLSLVENQILHLCSHYSNDLSLVEALYGKSSTEEHQNLPDKAMSKLSFDRVDILDMAGTLIGSIPSDPARIGFDLSLSDGYRLAVDSTDAYATNDAVFDSISGRAMHVVTKRTGFGYLVGFYDPQELRSLLTSVRFTSGHLAIVDTKGRYLAHTMDNMAEEQQTDPYFASLADNPNGGKLVLYFGHPYFIRSLLLENNHMTLMYYLSLSAYWHVVAGTIFNAFVSLIFMGLILRIVVNKNLNRMNQAFTTLRVATQNIAAGVYVHDVNKNTYRELHPLIESFLYMSREVELREEEVARLHHEREGNFLTTITLMAKAIEAKDQYTGDHCERVKHYALLLGKAIGLDPDAMRSLTFGSILHDIGKIGIDERLLNKPGRLDPDEYARIKEHCRIGASILGDVSFLKDTHAIILSHHEAVDGSGYPYGLTDEEIPLLAKIVAIADAYDAMTSLRPYRYTAMSMEEAIKELESCAGKQFNAALVKVFVSCVKQEFDETTKKLMS